MQRTVTPAPGGAPKADAPLPGPSTASEAPAAAGANVGRGIALMAMAMLIIPGIDAIAKLLTGLVSPGQVALSRFVVQAAIMLPFVIYLMVAAARPGNADRPKPQSGALWVHALRGALIAIATLCFFAAVQVMPLPDTIAIFFVAPLILTVLSSLVLGETIGWRRGLAVVVGFAGALLIVQPSFENFGVTALLPLGAAAAFSVYMILTRLLAQTAHPALMQFWAGVFGGLLMAVALVVGTDFGIAVLTLSWPSQDALLLLMLLGVIATGGHVLVVLALRDAPASVVAPFQYLEIFSATALGYLLFNDLPDALTWLGIAIICGSGLYVIHRERQVARGLTPPLPRPAEPT